MLNIIGIQYHNNQTVLLYMYICNMVTVLLEYIDLLALTSYFHEDKQLLGIMLATSSWCLLPYVLVIAY